MPSLDGGVRGLYREEKIIFPPIWRGINLRIVIRVGVSIAISGVFNLTKIMKIGI